MTRNTILAIALGGCALSVLPACKPGEDTTATAEESAPAIKVFNLMHQEVTDYGEWFGYLRGEQDTDIHPRISGFLISQEYKDGTRVKAGDVLFTLTELNFEAISQLCSSPDYKNRLLLVATAKEPTLRLKLASGVDSLKQSKVFISHLKNLCKS